MASKMSIDDLIRQSANPFDRINVKPGTFWGSDHEVAATVESIHQSAIDDITQRLEIMRQDHKSRSVLLIGDSGSGKSHLLTRLRQNLNKKAFFAYIGPWVDSQYIWRHVLRYTIDSLMQVPQGESESQLILWLKGLSAFTKRTLKQRVFDDSIWGMLQSDRRKFINHLKKHYKAANIYNSDIFFGVLYDLTEPDLYDLACEWLRGDDLGEDSMQLLRVKRCVESEDDAKNILANISKIATDTLPIVLCFDNLDNIPHLEDGNQDFQSLFNVNTIIHNDNLKNFLVIISVITNTWRRNCDKVNAADVMRLDRPIIQLRQISLDQAEALWTSQLAPLHQSAQFPSPIAPLTRQILEDTNPSGKTTPRKAIIIGREQYQAYKMSLVSGIPQPKKAPRVLKKPAISPPSVISDTGQIVTPAISQTTSSTPAAQLDRCSAEFLLRWQQERSRMTEKITKITVRSSPELIQMLLEVITALDLKSPRLKAITGNYASYSLQFIQPNTGKKVAIVWTEDAGMTTFYHVMSACQKAINGTVNQLHLIRAGSIGDKKKKGYEIYQQIFTHSQHQHIKPTLASVQELAAYHSLVNAAMAGELVLGGKSIALQDLQALVRETHVLQSCQLLNELGIVVRQAPSAKKSATATPQNNIKPIHDYILQTLTVQQYMGRKTLIDNTVEQFQQASSNDIEKVLQQLCQEQRIQIINPDATVTNQLICWVPNT
jgi:hypothetical protein